LSPFVRVGCGNFILTNSIAFFYSISLTSIVTLQEVAEISKKGIDFCEKSAIIPLVPRV